MGYYCDYTDACDINLLPSSKRMTDEEFEEFAKDADIFFFSYSDWDERYAEKKEMLDRLKSVQNKQVFDLEGSGAHAWWEQRMAEYDVVLEDICTVANKTTDVKPHSRHYLRNVFTEEVGQMGLSDVCEDYDAPLVSRADECQIVPKITTSTATDDTENSSFCLKYSNVFYAMFAIFLVLM